MAVRSVVRPHLSSGKGFGKSSKAPAKPVSQSPESKAQERATVPTVSPTVVGQEEEGDVEEEEGQESLPQEVADRMLRRMVGFAGVPAAMGLGVAPLLRLAKEGAGMDVKPWQALIVSVLLFGMALAGVTYGAVSASWDPARRGSLLGWAEARANLPAFLNRNRPRK